MPMHTMLLFVLSLRLAAGSAQQTAGADPQPMSGAWS